MLHLLQCSLMSSISIHALKKRETIADAKQSSLMVKMYYTLKRRALWGSWLPVNNLRVSNDILNSLSVFSFDSIIFAAGALVFSCSNTGSIRDDPY